MHAVALTKIHIIPYITVWCIVCTVHGITVQNVVETMFYVCLLFCTYAIRQQAAPLACKLMSYWWYSQLHVHQILMIHTKCLHFTTIRTKNKNYTRVFHLIDTEYTILKAFLIMLSLQEPISYKPILD